MREGGVGHERGSRVNPHGLRPDQAKLGSCKAAIELIILRRQANRTCGYMDRVIAIFTAKPEQRTKGGFISNGRSSLHPAVLWDRVRGYLTHTALPLSLSLFVVFSCLS